MQKKGATIQDIVRKYRS